MEEILQKISNDFENAKYLKKESTWYNGHGYMPLIMHKFNFNHKSWRFSALYEHRVSEFESSQVVSGGAYNTRHIYKFTCKKKVNNKHRKFNMYQRGLFGRLLFKKQSYIFSCKDSLIKNLLKKDKKLDYIFSIIEDGEFSPYITGLNKKDGIYEISVNFLTKKYNDFIIFEMSKVLLHVIKKLDNVII